MPSLAQLQAEPWWNREVVTGELDRLGDRLCAQFGRPRSAFGSKGDENHMRGAHRSQEWILNSAFCTSTTYTVQSGLTEWQKRHIAGGDFTPGVWGTSSNRQLMAQITGRCIAAAKANRLPGVIEIGGTLDGRTATGWHVVQRRVLSFDSSHLDHGHFTFDRRALEDRAVMDNLFNIMIGDDVSWEQNLTAGADMGGRTFTAGAWLIGANWTGWEGLKNDAAIMALLNTIAGKLGADPAELEAIKAAALAGAQQGVVAAAQQLAVAIAAALSDDLGLTPAEAEAAAERALRRVLGGVDGATPQV